jgi:hypothetical protein
MEPMKLQFLNLVPRPVRIAAAIIVGCGALVGPVVGYVEGTVGSSHVHNAALPALLGLAGLGIGLMVSSFVAAWLMGLGYVYMDAERRAMPAVLWVLVAALVPNLLGFLLYFAIRRPVVQPCSHCGQLMVPEQRFCSWCGTPAPAARTGGYVPTAAA